VKSKYTLVAASILLFAVAILAQSGSTSDPITGTWTGTPREVTFSLKYDGKNTVTGTVVPQPGALTKGSFDPKTGDLKLEGESKNPNDGTQCHFVMQGKVENGVASGTAYCGDQKVADFKMTRK
jgi:hypothetical protein